MRGRLLAAPSPGKDQVMAVTKKKAGKGPAKKAKPKGAMKKAKPNGHGAHPKVGEVYDAVQVHTVETLVETVDSSLVGVQEFIESIEEGVIFPQKLLEFGVILERLAASVSKTRKAFDAKALGHKDTEGSFEHGKVAITFPETLRRSPKWKDEATDRARQLAEAEGEDFDPKAFVADIITNYPPTVIRKVKLTESA